MVCSQVPEVAAQLNSADAFVLRNYHQKKVYAWTGRGASAAESQAAFNNATVRASAGVEVVQVAEGEESEDFWNSLGGKGPYNSVKAGELAPRDPRLFHLSNATGSFRVEEVFAFEQEDLNDEDVYLLDSFTTVFLWVGSKVRTCLCNVACKVLLFSKSGGASGTPGGAEQEPGLRSAVQRQSQ